MNLASMTRARLAFLVAAATFALVPAALAAKGKRENGKKAGKAAPACGITFLPLTPGTVWVYAPVVEEKKPEANKTNFSLPSTYTVEVLKVEPAEVAGGAPAEEKKAKSQKPNKGARVTLRESYRKVSRVTTIECNEYGLFVDPQSFFYTGEIGGGLGMELSDIKRGEEPNPTWPGKEGLQSGDTWREDLTAIVKRTPAKDSGLAALPEAKIEIEREVRIGKTETATTSAQEYPKAVHVDVGLEGRAFGQDKAVAMPESRAAFWFSEGVGLVRVENRFAQVWELVESKTAGDSQSEK
jgi:hypothetical protein